MNATLSCPAGVPQTVPGVTAPGWRLLAGFREELHRCLTRRRDALFCLADAVLCEDRRVTDLARLSLVPEFGRGHGALYDGLNAGRVNVARLRTALAGLPLPRWPDGRIRLAADMSHWLRPEAETSPGRLHCHVHSKGGPGGRTEPGWTYSVVTALGPGASSWTLPLDAARLGPDDDDTAAAAAQLREVVTRLIAAGQHRAGDPDILIAMDSGYNVTRLAWLLAGLPVLLTARVRSDRVFYAPAPPRPAGAPGRPVRHGAAVRCSDPQTQAAPDAEQDGFQERHGPVRVRAWNRMHQMLHRNCCGWEDWPSRHCPVIEGTLISVSCTRRGTAQEPMWLWASAPAAGQDLVRTIWTGYLRRFDIEHLFRLLKSRLGWTRPLLRDPAAADRWTWLLLACCAQLWLARGLAVLARMPWQPRTPAAEMTPGQVRSGFRRAREILGTPASARKPSAPGPGRPKGSKNKHKAPRFPVGKTRTRSEERKTKAKKRAKQAKRTG